MRKLFCLASFVCLIEISGFYAQTIEWGLSLATFPGEERSIDIEYDVDGSVYLLGTQDADLDLDSGLGEAISTGQPADELFLVKYGVNGEYLWNLDFDYIAEINAVRHQIKAQSDGGVLLVGSFIGSIDFNPNSSPMVVESLSSYNVFLASYNSEGELNWIKTFGNAFNIETCESVAISSEEIIITGYFFDSLEFQTTSGTTAISSSGLNDIYIIKMDWAGNIHWATSVGSPGNDACTSACMDSQGNITLSGAWGSGIFDADPGINSFPLISNLIQNGFIIKLDLNSNFLWANLLPGNYSDWEKKHVVDGDGNLYLIGRCSSDADIDPGPEVANISVIGPFASYVVKFNQFGSYIWHHAYSFAAGDLTFNEILIDPEYNHYYLVGESHSTIDADPGPMILELGENNSSNAFIAKFTSGGFLTWGNVIPGSTNTSVTCVAEYNEKLAISGNFTSSLDMDMGVGQYQLNGANSNVYDLPDLFLAAYEDEPCSYLVPEFNTIENSLECGESMVLAIELTNGPEPHSYIWNTTPAETGNSIVISTGGIQTAICTAGDGCSFTASKYISGPLYQSGYDLRANLICAPIRYLQATHMSIVASNDGCEVVNGVLVLQVDPILNIASVFPVPDNITGNVLQWNLDGIEFASGLFTVELTTITQFSASIGDPVQFILTISPDENDINPINNIHVYDDHVIAGMDPNVKKVEPAGISEAGLIHNNLMMSYTIQFQNTGEADAINIFVIDTIEEGLDMSSFYLLATSHSMILEVTDGHILKFKFDNINLPDSASNSEESHGYIVYSIAQNTDLPPGSIIRNTAYIYFDNNDVVATNSVINTIEESAQTVESDHLVSNYSCFPNPASDKIHILSPFIEARCGLIIFDETGKCLLNADTKTNIQGELILEIGHFSRGLYSVILSNNGEKYSYQFLKQE